MFEDRQSIERFIDHMGWIAQLEWPSDKEASSLTDERDKALASLPKEQIYFGAGQSKPHLGPLSPGCRACVEGTWSCLFINRLCTVDCFFCPQDRSLDSEIGPVSEGMNFEDPDVYLDYLEKCGFTGVSFSGGEPLLALDKVLLFMNKIRQRFGRKMYIWMYTNGSLVDEDTLQKLKESGLDEIRLNISARGYNLRPVRLARQFIDTVTVEIPVIPEDVEKLKTRLVELQHIGIDHLNIHQLVATKYNYETFAARNYTFLHPEAFHEPPLYESEMAALALLKFAVENELNLPINYCSHVYKARFQNMADRHRAAAFACEDYEQVTDAGYIRRLSVKGPAKELTALAAVLRQQGVSEQLWSADAAGTEVIVDGSLLHLLDLEACTLSLSYFEADLLPRQSSQTVRTAALDGRATLYVDKSLRAEVGAFAADGANWVRTLLIEADGGGGMAPADFAQAMDEVGNAQVRQALAEASRWEWVDSGFPAIS